MAYTFQLRTPDTEGRFGGSIKTDRATSKLFGWITPEGGKIELPFVTIELDIGERFTFVTKTAEGELVSYTFRPNPDGPKFPKELSHYYTWWVGECYDGKRTYVAHCVLSLLPASYDEPATKPVSRPPPRRTGCATLPETPQPVSM